MNFRVKVVELKSCKAGPRGTIRPVGGLWRVLVAVLGAKLFMDTKKPMVRYSGGLLHSTNSINRYLASRTIWGGSTYAVVALSCMHLIWRGKAVSLKTSRAHAIVFVGAFVVRYVGAPSLFGMTAFMWYPGSFVCFGMFCR